MSDEDIKDRWAGHYISGNTGKFSTARTENLNYRGAVLFRGTWPVSRLIMGADGKHLCISRSGEFARRMKNLRVPCIGVFTIVTGDEVAEGEPLNERLRDLWIRGAHDLLDIARSLSGNRLFPQNWEKGHITTVMQRDLNILSKQYEQYRDHVVNWPAFPTSITNEMDRIVNDKARVFFSGREILKRERASAKREARKAFDIE